MTKAIPCACGGRVGGAEEGTLVGRGKLEARTGFSQNQKIVNHRGNIVPDKGA